MADSDQTVRAWDPLVRIGHWILVSAFAVAYVSAENNREIHEWAGYTVAAYLMFRLIWGIVGSEHARFADFWFSPRRAISYLIDSVQRRAKRYIGHSPAGAVMVFMLLAALSCTTLTGMAELAAAHGEGPLTWAIAQRAEPSVSVHTELSRPSSEEERPESPIQEVHELFANLTLVLIALHLAGVIWASIVHRENLVASMIHGRKRK